MTDRRYGPADWTVDEVLRTHAEHTLQYQLALRVRELDSENAQLREELALARRVAELEADDANCLRVVLGADAGVNEPAGGKGGEHA